MNKVFIDGQAGTTGLQILERISKRKDINLLEIPHEERKNSEVKREYLNEADLVILCLHDDIARESVSMIENDKVKVLDASTAHRVNNNWVYGFPELDSNQRELIVNSRRVSNPGCYPTGFLAAVRPLVSAGIIPPNYPLTINAVSGFSGGGRQMIENYQDKNSKDKNIGWSYRPYSLGLKHKHLPEMKKYSGIESDPLFVPAVGDFEQGMLVSIPLVVNNLSKKVTTGDIESLWSDYYKSEEFIRVMDSTDSNLLENGFLSPISCNRSNFVDLFAFGSDEHILLVARLDNLGKGASGAAVQNMNLMLGLPEREGIR